MGKDWRIEWRTLGSTSDGNITAAGRSGEIRFLAVLSVASVSLQMSRRGDLSLVINTNIFPCKRFLRINNCFGVLSEDFHGFAQSRSGGNMKWAAVGFLHALRNC